MESALSTGRALALVPNEAGKSAAAWGAVVAGAFVAASASLILLALGSGLGFASMSPWRGRGVSAETIAIGSVIWLIVTQWLASAVGGYITGRLRVRWHGTHTHEVFFRDTANGLVTWAVATVLVAGVLGATAASIATDATQAAGAVAVASAKEPNGSVASPRYEYSVDRLLRRPASGSAAVTADQRAEVIRVMANALTLGDVPADDRSYLVELVSASAGVPTEEARKRVDDFIAAARDSEAKVQAAADVARKTSAKVAIFTALSMLIGAFIASVSAALGGRLRDEHS